MKIRLRHPCAWCGCHVRMPGCEAGCDPTRDRHVDALPDRCTRGRMCAIESDYHELFKLGVAQ